MNILTKKKYCLYLARNYEFHITQDYNIHNLILNIKLKMQLYLIAQRQLTSYLVFMYLFPE